MDEPIGVVLAGGAGRRLGGDKAIAPLGGRPLILYALAAMRATVPVVAIVAKAATVLPPLTGVEHWVEPDEPQHPLCGLVHALHSAGGRPVLVCPVDLPFIDAATLRRLAAADPGDALAVVAADPAGALQPLLGCYRPQARAALEAAGADAPMRATVAALGPRTLTVAEDVLQNINSQTDLDAAEARLAAQESTQPNVKS
jgi:molybdopterin-guanine dinucleotide biosynthesis protein A